MKGEMINMNSIGNYPVLANDMLSNVTGGSAVSGLSGAYAGATAGVKLCSIGGPWAMASCGVGGALIGTWFGLWKG